MQRSDFRELVLEIIKPHGSPFTNEVEQQNAVINRRLRLYSAKTFCLYDDAITLTLTQDVATYEPRGSAFSADIFQAEALMINGNWLKNYDGEFGPCSINDFRQHTPSYLTDTSGTPTRWAVLPNGTIRLWTKPDQAYSNCYVGAYVLHPELETGEEDEATELSIPEPYVHLSAAFFVAVGFLNVNVSTGTDLEVMRALSASAADEMEALTTHSRQTSSGSGRRAGGGYARTMS